MNTPWIILRCRVQAVEGGVVRLVCGEQAIFLRGLSEAARQTAQHLLGEEVALKFAGAAAHLFSEEVEEYTVRRAVQGDG